MCSGGQTDRQTDRQAQIETCITRYIDRYIRLVLFLAIIVIIFVVRAYVYTIYANVCHLSQSGYTLGLLTVNNLLVHAGMFLQSRDK